MKSEPKSIEILSPSLDDTIYVDANNRNLTIGITWKFTGDIKFVKIQHSYNGANDWMTLSDREKNDQVFEWKTFEWESASLIDGKNWIRIIDCNSNVIATQEFEVEFIWPKEKKMSIWKFIKKNWRWAVGIITGIIGIILVGFNFKWYIRILGAFLPFTLAYLRVIRK